MQYIDNNDTISQRNDDITQNVIVNAYYYTIMSYKNAISRLMILIAHLDNNSAAS